MLWDRFIRVFHWSLATGIVCNYWLLEGGDEPHEWLGYGLAALVLARVVWGFRGPENARFVNFIVGPRRALQSLRHFGDDYREHRGHSPLAGYMILFLLGTLLTVVATGWLQELDAFWGEEWPQTSHEIASDILIIAAAIHVTAVLFIQRRYRVPLLRSMLWKS